MLLYRVPSEDYILPPVHPVQAHSGVSMPRPSLPLISFRPAAALILANLSFTRPNDPPPTRLGSGATPRTRAPAQPQADHTPVPTPTTTPNPITVLRIPRSEQPPAPTQAHSLAQANRPRPTHQASRPTPDCQGPEPTLPPGPERSPQDTRPRPAILTSPTPNRPRAAPGPEDTTASGPERGPGYERPKSQNQSRTANPNQNYPDTQNPISRRTPNQPTPRRQSTPPNQNDTQPLIAPYPDLLHNHQSQTSPKPKSNEYQIQSIPAYRTAQARYLLNTVIRYPQAAPSAPHPYQLTKHTLTSTLPAIPQ